MIWFLFSDCTNGTVDSCMDQSSILSRSILSRSSSGKKKRIRDPPPKKNPIQFLGDSDDDFVWCHELFCVAFWWQVAAISRVFKEMLDCVQSVKIDGAIPINFNQCCSWCTLQCQNLKILHTVGIWILFTKISDRYKI